MSNAHTLLTKIRRDHYKLELTWAVAVVVLIDKQDFTEVWAQDAKGKPVHVTSAERDFLTIAREIESMHCDPLENFFQEVDEERSQQSEIDAENGYEYWLETRYADEYAAMPEWAK